MNSLNHAAVGFSPPQERWVWRGWHSNTST